MPWALIAQARRSRRRGARGEHGWPVRRSSGKAWPQTGCLRILAASRAFGFSGGRPMLQAACPHQPPRTARLPVPETGPQLFGQRRQLRLEPFCARGEECPSERSPRRLWKAGHTTRRPFGFCGAFKRPRNGGGRGGIAWLWSGMPKESLAGPRPCLVFQPSAQISLVT